MQMKTWKKAVILLLLVLLATIPLIGTAVADLGDYSGSSDFGGSSSSSSDDCEGLGWLIYYGLRLGCAIGECAESSGACTKGQVFLAEAIVVIALVILMFLFSTRRKKHNANAAQRMQGTAPRAQSAAPSPNVCSRIRAIDGNFSEEDLKEQLKNLYIRYVDCRKTGDLAPIRPYLTEQMYAQTEAELKAMQDAQVAEHTERLAILDTQLLGFLQRDGMDVIMAKLVTRRIEYRQSSENGRIVSGSNQVEAFHTVMAELVRKSGVKTRPRETGRTVRNCPCCGAPLSLNETSKCPYCDSVLPAAEDEWIIGSIVRR